MRATLARLTDIVHEQVINEREGVYAWRGRHPVITRIIADHKYYNTQSRYEMFEKIIDAISPSYDIEIRTIRDLCSGETGLITVGDKNKQNILLRKLMSIAPSERVPRHRLIRNLIELGQFDSAEAEIRLFQNDFRMDGPAMRYRINLVTARAVRAPGLLHEDRIALIEKAREIAVSAVARWNLNKSILVAYCDLGIEAAELTGNLAIFDSAIAELKGAEDRI